MLTPNSPSMQTQRAPLAGAMALVWSRPESGASSAGRMQRYCVHATHVSGAEDDAMNPDGPRWPAGQCERRLPRRKSNAVAAAAARSAGGDAVACELGLLVGLPARDVEKWAECAAYGVGLVPGNVAPLGPDLWFRGRRGDARVRGDAVFTSTARRRGDWCGEKGLAEIARSEVPVDASGVGTCSRRCEVVWTAVRDGRLFEHPIKGTAPVRFPLRPCSRNRVGLTRPAPWRSGSVRSRRHEIGAVARLPLGFCGHTMHRDGERIAAPNLGAEWISRPSRRRTGSPRRAVRGSGWPAGRRT